ncbi:uncharacterized protein LODBEIA_P16930 [Lodderomyces beijingensis]|uniref:Oligomycin resistance ATP-dependent permease YOR1 n=1 Tax=Lodderomyces beijingensis TaxID=1775926 RepID=A0ABP0ZH28_9ASCO
MDDDLSSLELGNNTYRPQKRLLTSLIPKKYYPIPKEDERAPYPESSSNWVSRIFFWWVWPLMTVGYARTLQPNDLWELTPDMTVQRYHEIFDFYLQVEMARAEQNHIEKKCKERKETVANSSVSPHDDLQDFSLPVMSVFTVLYLTMKRQIIMSVVMSLLSLSGMSLTPLLTKYLVQFVEERSLGTTSNVGKGIGYALGVVALMLISNTLFTHYFYYSGLMGSHAKALLTKAILRKSFKLNARSRHKYTQAKITSIITTDLSRVEIGFLFQPLLICLPVAIVIAIVILITNIKVAAVIGIVVFIVFLGFMSVGAGKLFAYRDVVSKITDKRVNLMKEILNNLKMIKYYSWEHPYHNNVTQVRGQEMQMILKMQSLRNIIYSLAMTLTGICSMIAFVILYAIDGKTSSPANMFSSVSSFEILALMVFFIPQALSTTADMIMAFRRVGALLSAPEEQVYPGYKVLDDPADNVAVKLNKASFSWEIFEEVEDEDETPQQKKERKAAEKKEAKQAKRDKKAAKRAAKKAAKKSAREESKNNRNNTTKEKIKNSEAVQLDELEEISLKDKEATSSSPEDQSDGEKINFAGLNDLNFEIQKGEFIVITGVVGSGKSSLLSAIAGFMTCDGGEIDINGSLLLCGAPWIQNNTIRENITFGTPFDQKYYDDVIYACALNVDIDNLEGGDYTEVGEKGITLSGGQKARINLARAVYANKEILLMDDVLSAVDARVGKHILNNCFLGLLKEKTRILATHQLSLIGCADKIIFLNGDGSIDMGEMDDLLNRNQDFSNLMKHSKFEAADDGVDAIEEENGNQFDEKDLGVTEEEKNQLEFVPKYSRSMNSTQEITRRKVNGVEVEEEEDDDEEYRDYNLNKDAKKGKLIVDEERAVNSLKFDVYKNYLKFGSGKLGPWLFLAIFALLLTIATFCDIFTNTWLSFWIAQKFPGRPAGFYIGIYVMFNILWVVFLTVTFIVFITGTTVSSKTMNLMAINRILYAPMSFMDTTPMGRILNRFTKDTDALDNEISDNLRMLFQSVAKMIGVFILLIIYLPWFALALPVIFVFFFLIANFYQASNREAKRLEAILRSFVYNNVNEMLSGMNTIKAFKEEARFDKQGDVLLNRANEASFIVNANQRWLGIQLDILAEGILLLIALLCVNRVFRISPASVGLLMTYSLQITGELNNLFRAFTMAENDMNSTERICHYALKLDQEAPYQIDSTRPPASWPEHGGIEFVNANMKYRAGLPLVLKDLSLKIAPSEKIGICGRTGAGKSSIMTALFRLAELESGEINIDNINIASIGLKDLRSHLSIIPQDPVLFNGTIRSNLDPFNEHTDDTLWDSLRRAGIVTSEEIAVFKTLDPKDENVELSKFHLYQTVEDEGENFSLGERQLISFARALVRDCKILILDEATSSVDYETDAKIQRTIASEFKHCTILCIAHRLKTILNYERILVMEKGTLKEFDTPMNLFNRVGGTSVFREMCDKSNIVRADFEAVH